MLFQSQFLPVKFQLNSTFVPPWAFVAHGIRCKKPRPRKHLRDKYKQLVKQALALQALGKMGKPSKNGDLSAKYEDFAGRDQDLLGRDWGI